jgi:hypothetical protein
VTVHRDSFFRRNPVRITKVENPFLQPAKVSGPPTEKPVFLEGKKTPPRFMRESVGKVQPERKPLSKELGRDIPSVERDPKVIEQKRITESPGKRTISETARNRVERIERPNRQTDTTQEKLVKRESTPVLTRERARGESQTPNPEVNKNRNTPIVPPVIIKLPNAKEPKYSQAISERNASRIMNQDQSGRIEQSNSNKENLAQRNLISLPLKDETRVKSPNPVAQSPQRNTSVSVNQNRAGRTGQPNSLQSLPPRQEGRAFAGRSSLPEGRSSPAPASKGQVKQNSHGSVGGLLGSSPLKSFR